MEVPRLEVVVIPVSDVDRARAFYQGLGWRLHADFEPGLHFRVVQLTPPGSACAIIFGTGVTSAAPGSAQGLQPEVAADIEAARAELAGHGVDVSEVFHDAGGVFHHAGTTGRVARPAPEHQTYGVLGVVRRTLTGTPGSCRKATTRLPGRATSALAAFDSVAGLADALRRAEAAHAKYEQETGKADPDGPAWYARFMADEAAAGTGRGQRTATTTT